MNAIGAATSFAPQLSSALSNGTGTQAPASVAIARDVQTEKGNIQILTAEGDRVSISFRTRDAFSLVSAQSGATSGTGLTLVSRGRLQVAVDGNLNADEQKAVGDLLSQIDTLATQFFGGDVQAAFNAAAQIGYDPKEIAGFSVDLTYTQKLTAAIASTASSPAAAPQPDTTAVPPGAPSDTTLPAAGSQAPAQDTSSQNLAPANAFQTIVGFLRDVLSSLASATPDASHLSFSMQWKVALLVSVLPSYAPSKQAGDSAGTQLMGDTLKQLAA